MYGSDLHPLSVLLGISKAFLTLPHFQLDELMSSELAFTYVNKMYINMLRVVYITNSLLMPRMLNL